MFSELQRILDDQSGVIARAQLQGIGVAKHDIDRLVRRRELVRVLPGVYLNHTGEPTWLQRDWAGVLNFAPAALAHDSALRAANGPGWQGANGGGRITIVVDQSRRVVARDGYRVVRRMNLDRFVQWNRFPPRIRLDEALVDVASGCQDNMDALEILAEACRSRRTTAERLLVTLRGRERVRQREWLVAALSDIAAGTTSVLEHGFLVKVQRAHGLPLGARQVSELTPQGRVYRDVDYEKFGVLIELDGRLHEGFGLRNRDLSRDVLAAVGGRQTVRLGWHQVHGSACETAMQLSLILRARGWTGQPVPCGVNCTIPGRFPQLSIVN